MIEGSRIGRISKEVPQYGTAGAACVAMMM